MAALRDVERGARRVRTFVAGEVSVALALEFVTRGEQVRASHTQIDARSEGVDVAFEIADRSEGRLAEGAYAERPVEKFSIGLDAVIVQPVTRLVIQSLREVQRAGEEAGFAAVVRVVEVR